jgi:hypothetical protein
MRRLFAILALVSLLASYLVFTVLPASADANAEQCWQSGFIYRNDTASPASAHIDLHDSSPQTHLYEATFTLQPGETRTLTIHGLFPLSAQSFSSSAISGTLTFVGFGNFGRVNFDVCAGFGKIDDGRINAYDLGAPLAAYCTSDGGIAVWDIDDTGHGTLAFTSSKSDISKALSDAQSSGQNVLVGEGLGDNLYALSTNQLTLVGPDVKESGKTYEFVTTGDHCG